MVVGIVVFQASAYTRNISLTVLAPTDSSVLYSLNVVRYGVEIATEHVNKAGILRNFCLCTTFVDSNETKSDIDTLVLSIRSIDRGTRFFLGPSNDFAVTNVARYAGRWNVPIVTPGGFNYGLAEKYFVPTLTRMHVTFDSMAYFLRNEIFKRYKWSKIKTISENFRKTEVFYGFCNIAIESIQDALKHSNIYIDKYEIRMESNKSMLRKVFKEIGVEYGG